MDFVLDASSLLKRFLEGPGYQAFRSWDREQEEAGATRGAPPLLPFEAGNAIAREVPEHDPDEQALHLEDMLQGIRLVDPDPKAVFRLAGHLTFYDAAYLALARERGATLVTYDDVLADAAEERGVEVLSP